MTSVSIESDEITAAACYVAERTGLSFTGARHARMLAQLGEAMVRADATTAATYRALLDREVSEFDRLMARLTIPETYFFRESKRLEVLRRVILPERRRALGSSGGLRLWSAGCATGPEAYTLAIILEQAGALHDARIVGTDISAEALRIARSGVYTSWSLRAADDAQRQAYFRQTPGGFRVDARFTRPVSFRQMNLLDDVAESPRRMAVILCRNVLIYFSPAAVALAGARLAASLAPGGWLVTGVSDPPLDGIDGLQPIRTAAGVVYRRIATPSGAAPAFSTRPTTPAPPITVRQRMRTHASAADLVPGEPTPICQAPLHNGARGARGDDDDNGDGAAVALRALGGAGDLRGAIDASVDAIAQFPMHTELRLLHAIALLEAGRPTESVAAGRAALYLDPQLVMAHLAVARAEEALGHTAESHRSMRRAAQLLDAVAPDTLVAFSDGEQAGRLAAMVAAHGRPAAASVDTRRAR